MIKLMKHYATDGRIKARVTYSHGVLTDGRECVTLYAKDYTRELGQVFSDGRYANDTDLMSDYHDKGRVRIYPADPLYAAAKARTRSPA